ncbi:MAG TPA: hypothetical protein VGR35_20100 [Tepidisphaeraceae bacterium]|nr:hypothetical protein [Tepidisphaeraceae bacterium]
MKRFCSLIIFAAWGFALAGCGAQSKQPTTVTSATSALTSQLHSPARSAQRLTISDPCPTRLHDICGPLLVYLTTNYRLPEHLDELRQMPGSEPIGEFVCATSKQPYVYNPAGIIGANVAQRAVIYDAAPTHSGYRWAIVIKEATPSAPFIAEVVAWPESRFPRDVEN